MQAITALAHLHSTVLYFLDISEACGYSLQKQVALFHSIKPLFQNKPLLIVANKTDLKKLDQLDDEERALVEGMLANRPDSKIMPMSNMTEAGITAVLHTGCDMLLAHRVEKKMASTARMQEMSNRLVVTQPTPRDNKERPVSIPASVLAARAEAARRAELGAAAGPAPPKRKTERDLELEGGGPGIYNIDLRKHYLLANPDWKYDIIPEFMDGKNIADFVDVDIEKRLAELEAEEAVLEAQAQARGEMLDDLDSDLEEEEKEAVSQIRHHRSIIIANRRFSKSNNKPVLPRAQRRKDLHVAADHLEGMGLDAEKMVERARSRSVKRTAGIKRVRDASRGPGSDDEMADVEPAAASAAAASASAARTGRSKTRTSSSARTPSGSRFRSQSRDHKLPRVAEPSPFRNIAQKVQAEKLNKKTQKSFQQKASRGESDRKVLDMKPKHLFSGKTGFDRDRR
jgi:nucleolar GTP-binding protein